METPEHEAKCQRCGISCHASLRLEDGRDVVVEGLHCKFLEPWGIGQWACSVYEKRFEVAPWCHSVASALPQGLLRHDCPYTDSENRIGGKVHVSAKEYASLWPEIQAKLLAMKTVNPHFSWNKFFKYAKLRDPDGAWLLQTNAVGTASRVLRTQTLWSKLKSLVKGGA